MEEPRSSPSGAAHGLGADVRGGGPAAWRQPLRLDGDGGGAEAVVRGPAAGMPPSPAGMVWPRGRLPGTGETVWHLLRGPGSGTGDAGCVVSPV